MSQTVEAVYDGAVLRPETALELEPNTRVRLTVEVLPAAKDASASFLRTARSLDLHGPADWSANLDSYLFGDGDQARRWVSGIARQTSVEESFMQIERITHNPAVMGGKPCIRGLRVTVGTILGLLASGKSRERILQAYSYLEPEDIDAALAYAAWRLEEREEPLVVTWASVWSWTWICPPNSAPCYLAAGRGILSS
jgi:uncharacterized protein (DUF433 family)